MAGKSDSKGNGNGKGKGKGNGKSDRMGKGEYQEKLAPLQLELNRMARWLQATARRLVVVIEGRDTAGKGGDRKSVV